MAATDWPRRLWRALAGALAVTPAAQAVDLGGDRAEVLLHAYDGGGVKATGPALLVRKTLKDRVALSGSVYIDHVSNASVDVVTSASPYRENRTAVDLGAEVVLKDALVKIGVGQSREPDYRARSLSLDVAQDFFGAMSTLNLGFTRGADDVGKTGVDGFIDRATHWQYRLGLTQILTPRWLASVNLEALADDGLLGSPYRVARLYGAAVPERLPRTRSGRALRLSARGDVERLGGVLRTEWRHYWDNWGLKAETVELSHARAFGSTWQAEALLRWHHQKAAHFYRDDAESETRYLTRNRQLGSFDSWSLGAKARHALPWGGDGTRWWLNAAYEFKRFDFRDFTDLRTGQPYAHNAHLLQVHLSTDF
ncbi:MAG: DUF3570 domain-containing protein [Rubrivivax sp.]